MDVDIIVCCRLESVYENTRLYQIFKLAYRGRDCVYECTDGATSPRGVGKYLHMVRLGNHRNGVLIYHGQLKSSIVS